MNGSGRALLPRFAGRQLRSAPVALATIIATTAITGAFVVAAPRLLVDVSNEDLRVAVEGAEPEQRNIEVALRDRIDPGAGDPYGAVRQRGVRFLDDEMPTSVQELIVEQHFVVTSPRFRTASFPDERDGPFPTSFRFRYQSDLDQHLRLVSGDMPTRQPAIPMLRGGQCPDDVLNVRVFEFDEDVDCDIEEIPVVDTVITAASADAMMLEVGDRVMLRPDGEDAFFFNATSFQMRRRSVLRIAGLVELSEPELEYWYADSSLHRPRITENSDFRLIFATGVMPDDYGNVLNSMPFVEFEYTWRYLVDPDALDAETAASIASDLKTFAPADVRVVTQLPRLLDEFAEQRRLAVSLTSTAVAGLLAAASGSMLMLAMLMATRQRTSTVLIRNRGAGRTQLLAAELVRGVVAIVPATALGWLVALVLLPDPPIGVGRGPALVVAVSGLAAFVLAGTSPIIRPLASFERREMTVRTARVRRVVGETVIAIAAVGAVFMLRRRGSRASTSDADVDALFAVAPALIAFATGLLVLRITKPLAVAGAWFGARRCGIVAFLGFRRHRSQPASAGVPVVVVVVSLGIAVFVSIVQTSVETGQSAHAWQVVGADLRLESPTRGSRLTIEDLTTIAAQDGVATGVEFADVDVIGTTVNRKPLLLALDIGSAADVIRTSDTDDMQFGGLADSPAERSSDAPIPVIVTGPWSGDAPLRTGLEFGVVVGRATVGVVVTQIAPRFPSIPLDTVGLIMDVEALRRIDADLVAVPTVLFIDDRSEAAVTATAMDDPSRVRRFARSAELGEFDGDPFVDWVGRGLLIAVVLAGLFASGAAVSSVALTAAGRRRDLGLVRILGLQTRQATALTAVEQAPALLIAALGGSVLGVVMARLLGPALRLEAFTGGLVATEMVINPASIAWLVAVFTFAIASSVAVSIVVLRRADESELSRMGGE